MHGSMNVKLIMTTRSFLQFRFNIVAVSTVHSMCVNSIQFFCFIIVVFIPTLYLFSPCYFVLCRLSMSFVTALCMHVPTASAVSR